MWMLRVMVEIGETTVFTSSRVLAGVFVIAIDSGRAMPYTSELRYH